MPSDSDKIKDLFLAAVERSDPAERAAFLDAACQGDAAVRCRVDDLLNAHRGEDSLLGNEPAPFPATTATPEEQSGDTIGPYKLLQRLGEGGMGVVYMAEQVHPVQRRVAFKIIKPGMDSRSVLARFEAERQALALMDHPNIARVFDAGATEAGRPYFVMELVKGVPITRYCDERHLTPRQRLELFAQVCQAVQHAHQKGVIHRDLKPSNVLVAEYDARPVPKVIDFGVAKATGPKLTDRTLFTELGVVVGTLEYMSPEQAKLNALDVDSRSDVYALGVLLYELLTGTTPFDRKRLREAAFDEVLRIIREEEPQKPSTRLSTTDELPGIAANRGTEPARLSGLVRGELDWIVMKALEKDRNRRYETANGFAMDVQRYLADEPVQACPPSGGYRFKKFVRRNRGTVLTAGAIAAALLIGTALASWQAVVATKAKRDAQAALKKEEDARAEAQAKEAEANAVVTFFEMRVFAAGRPKGDAGGLGHDVLLRDALNASLPALATNFKDQPLVEARLRRALGSTYWRLGRNNQAVEQLEQARALFTGHRGPEDAATLLCMNLLANSFFELGRHAEALKLREETLEIQRRALSKDHPDTLMTMNNLANSYDELGRRSEALKLREETLEIKRRVLPEDHPDTLTSMHNLAISYAALGRHAEVMNLFQKTLEIRRRVLPKNHPDTLKSMQNLAISYDELGRYAEALKLREETLEIQRRVLPKDHSDTLKTMMGLANSYDELGRHSEAVKLLEETLEIQRRVLPKHHFDTLSSMNSLANSYFELGRHAEALKLNLETLEIQRRVLSKDHPSTLITMNNLADCYAAVDRLPEALKFREETLEIRRRILPQDHPRTLMSMNRLADTYVALGRHTEAFKLVEEFLPKADLPGVDRYHFGLGIATRVACLQKAGNLPECRSTADLLEKRNPGDTDSLYNAARCRAMTASLQAKAKGPDAAKLAKEDADKAMAWLQKSLAAGFKDVAHMKKDADLDALRDRDDFKKLIAELEAKKK